MPPGTVEFLNRFKSFPPFTVVRKGAPGVLVLYEDVYACVAAAGRFPAANLHRREDSASGTTVLYFLRAVEAAGYMDMEGL